MSYDSSAIKSELLIIEMELKNQKSKDWKLFSDRLDLMHPPSKALLDAIFPRVE